MEDEDKKSAGFKVTDRRRIDELGEDRNRDETVISGSTRANVNQSESAISSSAEIEVREDTKDVTFSSFLMSLATQALMQLGQLAPPPGVDLAVDREAARQTIDIINMLHKKTKGNLDKDEQRLFDEIVHSLRLQFVQRS
jgi:hypothetical protein